MALEKGLCYNVEKTVTPTDTAEALESGTLAVLATPKLIAWMELACRLCVQPYIGEAMTTVGTEVDIKHIAATPVGMTVEIKATLAEVDNRRLVFFVEAFDEQEKIGYGLHERFVVDVKKFMTKANGKR